MVHQTADSLRVNCTLPLTAGDGESATYVLHVYDAETRRLMASTTSDNAAILEITDLPATSTGALLLAVRTVTEQATSEAVNFYTVMPKPPMQQRAPGGKISGVVTVVGLCS